MAKNEKNQEASASNSSEEQVVAAPIPDASAYVLQPTSHKLDPALGEVHHGRFYEEVVRGSDEEDSSTESWDAHPVENQPAYGVTEKGQPDTSGRIKPVGR